MPVMHPQAEEQAAEMMRPLRDVLERVKGGEEQAVADLGAALDTLEYQVGRQCDRAELHKGRLLWLEAELRAGPQAALLGQLSDVFRTASEALAEKRRADLDKILTRQTLDDRQLAVTIDSLAAMRDRLRDEGHETPDVDGALAAFQRMALPDATVAQVGT